MTMISLLDISAWGSIGELVGAIAVVLSVVYLASQINDSARMAVVQAHQNQTRTNQLVLQMLVDHPECWRLGHIDPDALPPADLGRFHALLYAYLLQLADMWHARRHGVFDREVYDAWTRAVASFVNTEGGSMWWSESRPLFIPELAEAIEALRPTVPPWTAVHPRQFYSDVGGEDCPSSPFDQPPVLTQIDTPTGSERFDIPPELVARDSFEEAQPVVLGSP